MDEHRALTTVQEVRRLADRAAQVIVLSHNKRFLCRIWEGVDKSLRAAMQVIRDGSGSTIDGWDVGQDSITEHDRRHELLRQFIEKGIGHPKDVARSIRPTIEALLRVLVPEHFPPGTLLGTFRSNCERQAGTASQILSKVLTQELRNLTEYANKYQHDTNPAWETEEINDGELKGFVERVLRFGRN